MNPTLRSVGLTCLKLLNEAGYEAWWVGGCVRDTLLGRPVQDVDVTTSALPEQTIVCFRNAGYPVIPTGLKHGTVTVMIQDIPIEVTTYRSDSDYQDHRHPESVRFTRSLWEDCARRDFTINALCWHPDLGLRDYFHGQRDLKNKVIACIGNPYQRFNEDALRILRALRFASTLGFALNLGTRQALFHQKELLRVLSAERIAREMEKMVVGLRWPEIFANNYEILAVLFPQLPALQSPQAIQKAFDAFRFCPPVTLPRLACFFLETEQTPLVYCIDQAQHWTGQLKFSNQHKKNLIQLVRYQNHPIPQDRVSLRLLIHELPDRFGEWIQLQQALNRLTSEQAARLIAASEEIRGHDCLTLKQLAINGADLIAAGCPRPQISALLKQSLNAVMEDQIPNQKAALLRFITQQRKPEHQE